MLKYLIIYFCTASLIFFYSCSSLKDAGNNLGTGAINGLQSGADSLSSKLVNGAAGSLTSDSTRVKLEKFIDSLVASTGESTNTQLLKIRDSVLDDYINLWIQKVVKNASQSLNSNILDDKTTARLKQELNDLVSQIGANLLNDTTLFRISMLRDTLLGEQTNNRIKAIIDSAASAIIYKINSGLSPEIKENVDFIEKNAAWFIILVGITALVIIWFVWRQKEKYLQMTKMLVYHISEVPEKRIKENLKDNISKNAKIIGIEDDLRKLLHKLGLLHLDKKT
jgi:hypothetical protein